MMFDPTAISDVILIKPEVFEDTRGFFMETWQQKRYAANGLDMQFVQDNHSRSLFGTLRGLHYQIKHPQGKLIWVPQGEVFDVAVDLRKNSATFGAWVGSVLSEGNRHQLWVPPGFAHGFLVLSEVADLVYKCTDYYYPEHERTIKWDDPNIGVNWPVPADTKLLLSDKDISAIPFKSAEYYQ